MEPITFGILTISDSCAADNGKDASGPEAAKLVADVSTETGAVLRGKILCRDIVPDDASCIVRTLEKWSDEMNINVVLTTGGTGFSQRDVTPEATRRVIEKEAPGISLAILKTSLDVTPMAMLSRAVCGIRGKTLIINLPGSPKAVRECLTTVAKVIPHAVAVILGSNSKIAEDHTDIQKSISMDEKSSKRQQLETRLMDVGNRLRESPFPMISLDDAKREIATRVRMYLSELEKRTEFVTVEKSRGRILGDSIISCCDLPPFRASVKDGYAVIAADGRGTRRVLGGVEAGHEHGIVRLISGTCVRVNTGAPIPDEATAVVQVEDTELRQLSGTDETSVEILAAPTEGQDIRPVGCDIKKGTEILQRGTKIGVVEMGILAACGIAEVNVYRVPRVGILSTGNELQTAGEPAKPGHVYDSNKITLMALMKESGYDPIDFGIVVDDVGTMIAGIAGALDRVDVLVTSGSVSMGDRDMLKPILHEVFGATIHFGRVNLKPGKPTTFATCRHGGKTKFLLCLPGNPVSATVTAHLFAIPLLRWLNMDNTKPIVVTAKITEGYKLDPRPEYARASLVWKPNDGLPDAYITGNQMSSMLMNCRNANALLILPGKTKEKGELKPGDSVPAMMLSILSQSSGF